MDDEWKVRNGQAVEQSIESTPEAVEEEVADSPRKRGRGSRLSED